MIQISVNNEIRHVAEQTPLSQALQQWGFVGSPIAVAINSEFVPRSSYAQRMLVAGDLVDIVKPVGGG